jgi:hypothetical protein
MSNEAPKKLLKNMPIYVRSHPMILRK